MSSRNDGEGKTAVPDRLATPGPTGPGQIAAVVLAAGASSRMGQPKARLEWTGRSYLECACALARQSHCRPIVVICGAHDLHDILPADANGVSHTGWADGQLSSLQAGIAAIRPRASADPTARTAGEGDFLGVLVLTVDRPRIQPGTVQSLVDAAREDPNRIWQPRFAGRSGHPIFYPTDIADLLCRLSPTATARDLLGEPDIAARRASIDVEDPRVLENIDTPADVAKIRVESPRR